MDKTTSITMAFTAQYNMQQKRTANLPECDFSLLNMEYETDKELEVLIFGPLVENCSSRKSVRKEDVRL